MLFTVVRPTYHGSYPWCVVFILLIFNSKFQFKFPISIFNYNFQFQFFNFNFNFHSQFLFYFCLFFFLFLAISYLLFVERVDGWPYCPHSTEYCRKMSGIFPIFNCNGNIVATFSLNIEKYFIATMTKHYFFFTLYF